jgi:hypothetical protein
MSFNFYKSCRGLNNLLDKFEVSKSFKALVSSSCDYLDPQLKIAPPIFILHQVAVAFEKVRDRAQGSLFEVGFLECCKLALPTKEPRGPQAVNVNIQQPRVALDVEEVHQGLH